jgi:catechol 2,3-dioxygenase-like lactoylglutathione lyase family enzyme
MLKAIPLIAFVATTDFSRAREFYGELLGLAIISESPFALDVDAAGTMLRVTKVAEIVPAPYTVLGWRVPDIRQSVSELKLRGIVFERYPGMQQDDLGIWTSPSGARVAWFKDRDGNVLSLTEFS